MTDEVTALVVVDVQAGFDDEAYFGPRNNPSCEENIERLIETWRHHDWPVVFVRHDSREPGSPLAPGSPGNAFKSVITGEPDLLVVKSVHSAFYGEPDLHEWLRDRGIKSVAICGIQTNVCCETTARMAGDLGYDVLFIADATHTFDLRGTDGTIVAARQLARVTGITIAAEFGATVYTSELVD